MVPLCYEDGSRIRERGADSRVFQEAHARWILARNEVASALDEPRNYASVVEVCVAYLGDARANGAKKTFVDRADTQFDFCYGLPPQYRSGASRTMSRTGRPASLCLRRNNPSRRPSQWAAVSVGCTAFQVAETSWRISPGTGIVGKDSFRSKACFR